MRRACRSQSSCLPFPSPPAGSPGVLLAGGEARPKGPPPPLESGRNGLHPPVEGMRSRRVAGSSSPLNCIECTHGTRWFAVLLHVHLAPRDDAVRESIGMFRPYKRYLFPSQAPQLQAVRWHRRSDRGVQPSPLCPGLVSSARLPGDWRESGVSLEPTTGQRQNHREVPNPGSRTPRTERSSHALHHSRDAPRCRWFAPESAGGDAGFSSFPPFSVLPGRPSTVRQTRADDRNLRARRHAGRAIEPPGAGHRRVPGALSANIDETSVPLGITVGRWR